MERNMKLNKTDLVRNILSCNYSKDGARDDLVANVLVYALHNTSNVLGSNDGGLSLRYDNIGIGAGQISPIDDCITISSNAFLNNRSYSDDITVLAHEVWHYAQYKSSNADLGGYIPNKSVLDLATISDMIRRLTAVGSNSLTNNDLTTMSIMAERYIKAKYFLDPCEVLARDYSVHVLNSLIADGKKLPDMTALEMRNIKYLSVALKRLDRDHEFLGRWAERTVGKYDDMFISMVRELRTRVFAKDASGSSEMDRFVNFDREFYRLSKNYKGNIFEQTAMGLILDYDESCARNMVDIFLDMDEVKYCDNWKAFNYIVLSTNYVLDDRQRDIVRSRGVRGDCPLDLLIEHNHTFRTPDFSCT